MTMSSVATNRNLDLAATLSSELANVVALSAWAGDSVRKLAAIWILEGIESVVFPSATGAGERCSVSRKRGARASSFAIVPKSWRPFADTCWEAWLVAVSF